MIKYLDLRESAKKEGYVITFDDYIFCSYYVQGYPIEECYLLSYKANEPQIRALTPTAQIREIKKIYSNCKISANKVLDKDHIKWLILVLRPMYVEDVQKFVVANVDLFDFMPKSQKEVLFEKAVEKKFGVTQDDEDINRDIREALSRIIKENKGMSLSDENVKVLLDTIKLWQKEFAPPAVDEKSDIDMTIVMAYDKFNAICPSCNREIDVYRGIKCQCPHCQTWIDLTGEQV